MNQIISPINNNEIKLNTQNKNVKYYKSLLFFTIFIIFICIIIYFFISYNSYKKQKVSKNLINNFNITTLYANSTDLSLEKVNSDIPFVIGVIEIDKIDVTYPILSNTSEELLEISPCRFYGPMPNEIGNLCIAGHNYANNTIFGKLHYLEIGDIVRIYDLSGKALNYEIYNKKEVPATDTSCTNQDTNGKREVTLITCNTLNGNRVIFQCLELNLL